MKAKVNATGEILDLYPYHSGYWIDLKTQYLYREPDLEFLPDTPEKVLEGWVLRDDNNKTGIYREKPTCDEDGWDLTGEQYDLFPDITPDMLPKKYKITITPMEE